MAWSVQVCRAKLCSGPPGGGLHLVLCDIPWERICVLENISYQAIDAYFPNGWHIWCPCHHRGMSTTKCGHTKVWKFGFYLHACAKTNMQSIFYLICHGLIFMRCNPTCRWDERATSLLPNYLKRFYTELLRIFKDATTEVAICDTYHVAYVRKAVNHHVPYIFTIIF